MASCGASFDGTRFHKRTVDYRVGPLDARWQRVSIDDQDLAFSQPGQGSIGVHATCDGYEDVPASALLNHLLFGTTERVYVEDEEVALDGRGARHAVVDAQLDGVPVRLDLYVLVRSGCVFDLSYVSDRTAPRAADFEQFVRAFHVEAVRRD